MYRHNKHFTLEEAETLLPYAVSTVEKIVTLKRKLDLLRYDVYRHEYFGGIGPNGSKAHPNELEEMIQLIKELDEKGILFKGSDEGLIDFPHIRENGEEVYLCWKLGESAIAYWHRIPDGFAGRRRIDEL